LRNHESFRNPVGISLGWAIAQSSEIPIPNCAKYSAIWSGYLTTAENEPHPSLYLIFRFLGWRYGLHIVAGVFFAPFFTGTFNRSATLYHPQRRAIMHLKTQQRKFLERSPAANATKLTELKSFHNRSLHFALMCSFLASLGIYSPFINLVSHLFFRQHNDAVWKVILYYIVVAK
jgi:hypothetical protein